MSNGPMKKICLAQKQLDYSRKLRWNRHGTRVPSLARTVVLLSRPKKMAINPICTSEQIVSNQEN